MLCQARRAAVSVPNMLRKPIHTSCPARMFTTRASAFVPGTFVSATIASHASPLVQRSRHPARSLVIVAGTSRKARRAKEGAASEDDGEESFSKSTTTTTKANPALTKAAKDKARKAAATKARGLVSDTGRSYEKIVTEMGRDSCREYVLSVRQRADAPEEEKVAVLSDWLPICEVVVADKKAYEASLFFKKNGMSVPETEFQTLNKVQIEGVPAVRMMLPRHEEYVAAMAFVLAGVKDLNMDVMEYGLEDWGSFECAVDALAAQTNQKGKFEAAAALLGVSVDDEPADIKRVYRKLIAEAHPDRNPETTQEKFNAIKDAYELLSGRGDAAGITFEGLGDHRRDFVALDKAHFGVSSQDKGQTDPSSVAFAMRTLTMYDRVNTVFTTRNLKLAQRLTK